MSDTVYQFFIQQFIRFAGHEIKRKSGITDRLLQTSAIFYFHERAYKPHSSEIEYMQQLVCKLKITAPTPRPRIYDGKFSADIILLLYLSIFFLFKN